MDRNTFIKIMGRGAIFTALISITGYSVYKTMTGNPTDCPDNKYCSKCSKKASCNLPKAKTTTTNERK